MDKLEQLRKEINATDHKILEALSARRELAQRVIEEKAESERPLRDPQREQELLARVIADGRDKGLDAHFVTRVFHEIIDDSVRSQQLFLLNGGPRDECAAVKRVAYQGIEGAYSQLAAQKFFARDKVTPVFVGCRTFQEVIDTVEQGNADYALLPIENTTAGSINEVYDLLTQTDLGIIGEEIFPVEHCLLAVKDVPLSNIRRVLSHPQALAQCVKFIATLENCQTEYFTDTAMAVEKVKGDKDPSQAAIASEEAGRRFGLTVLQRRLADQRDNYTRFLVVARTAQPVDRRIPCKTSIVLATRHEEGALLKGLSLLHEHKINLTKLESRPRPGVPFQYLFYLDFEGNIVDENVADAVRALREVTAYMKVLGSYPMEIRGKTEPRPAAVVGPASGATTSAKPSAVTTPKKPQQGYPRGDPQAGLVRRAQAPGRTVINVRGVEIGGAELVVLAGPSSVESREQILACARQVKECGGKILRGGCFQARASSGSFQGLGLEGLELLSEAGRHYDLPVVTEVTRPEDIETISGLADILQVGSRNMHNYELLLEVGKLNQPVLLKRGVMATLEELLEAAEQIAQAGNSQVILCERGVRTFETMARNTLDLGAVPILRELTHLPIIVDPSRAAGRSDLVKPLAMAALALRPDGLMLQIHPDPASALSDGVQALDFVEFTELMGKFYAGSASA